MKKLIWTVLGLAAAAVAIALAIRFMPPDVDEEAPPAIPGVEQGPVQQVDVAAGQGTATAGVARVGVPAVPGVPGGQAAPPPEPERPAPPLPAFRPGDEPGRTEVLLKRDHVLARVNGKRIRASDLAVYGAGEPEREQLFSDKEYALLLKRAVERELTFQVAREEDLQLTEAQRAQMEQVRAAVRAREGGDASAVFLTHPGTIDEQMAFALRDAEANLLQNTLLEKAGAPPPHVGPEQVRAYYEQNQAEFGALPDDPAEQAAAWTKIDMQIRRRLAPQARQAWQEAREEYFKNLREQKQVDVLLVAPEGPADVETPPAPPEP